MFRVSGLDLCDDRVRGLVLRVRNEGAIDRRWASGRSPKLQKFLTVIPGKRKFFTVIQAKGDFTEPDVDPNPEIVKPALPLINLLAKWESLPSRYKLLFATGVAYIICNMVVIEMSLCVKSGLLRTRSI